MLRSFKRRMHYIFIFYHMIDILSYLHIDYRGVPASVIQAIIELEQEKERGSSSTVYPDVAQVLGRPGISIAQYIQDITPTLQKL